MKSEPDLKISRKSSGCHNRTTSETAGKNVAQAEIFPGKGSGQLKKTALRFLNRPEIKNLYHRIGGIRLLAHLPRQQVLFTSGNLV